VSSSVRMRCDRSPASRTLRETFAIDRYQSRFAAREMSA
jgi:hypothetical protein